MTGLKQIRISLPYLLVLCMAAGIGSFAVSDVIYYRQAGLDFSQIGMMVFCFNIAVTLAELPFAVLFDKHSAKLTLYIGFIIRIIAFSLFALNWGFSYFLAAQILAGIAAAAGSGTTSALVLNQVQEQNPQNMSAEKSRLTLFSGFGSLLGATIGIMIFRCFPPGIWWLACLFFAVALLIVCFFQDKPAEAYGMPLKTLFYKWRNIFKLRQTYLLILCNACAIGSIMLWQLKFQHISALFVAGGFYIMTIAAIAAGKIFPWLRLKPGAVKYNILFNMAAVLAFAFSEGAIIMPLALAACAISHIILSIQLEGMFHAAVPNTVRAGAGSLISLADSALAAIFAPAIGRLADGLGLNPAIGFSALLYLLLLIAAIRPKRTAGGRF